MGFVNADEMLRTLGDGEHLCSVITIIPLDSVCC